MLRYGIPSYRLPRERLQWDIDAIAAAGVEFKTDYDVQSGRNDSQDQGESRCNPYFHRFPQSQRYRHPRRIRQGCYSCRRDASGIGDDAMPNFNGRSVAVIGGGNVAMDVARTAKRLGASEVCIVYRRRRDDMTALPDEINGAIAEGCQLFQLKAPSEIIVDKKTEGQRPLRTAADCWRRQINPADQGRWMQISRERKFSVISLFLQLAKLQIWNSLKTMVFQYSEATSKRRSLTW